MKRIAYTCEEKENNQLCLSTFAFGILVNIQQIKRITNEQGYGPEEYSNKLPTTVKLLPIL